MLKGLVILLALAPATPGVAVSRQQPAPAPVEVVDRMIATVNDQLITYSDLLWQLALQPGTPVESPRKEDMEAALERLIDQRLVLQEAEKIPHVHANEKEIDEALSDLVRRFPSQAEFQQRMGRVGLTAAQLREIVHDRLDMEKYLDFRFRSFTVVTPQEVEAYYKDVYTPRARRQSPGRIVPKLEEVRGEIQKQLVEERVASDMGKYLEESRSSAEITILGRP